MRSMQQQLGSLGTISVFAFRHWENKKNLCRVGPSQDLPDTDFQPAIRQLKYVRQQYTHKTAKGTYFLLNNVFQKAIPTTQVNNHIDLISFYCTYETYLFVPWLL